MAGSPSLISGPPARFDAVPVISIISIKIMRLGSDPGAVGLAAVVGSDGSVNEGAQGDQGARTALEYDPRFTAAKP